MVNPSKTKGTAAETLVVGYLRTHGATHAERRALTGSQDRGDVAGIPGIVTEVKNCSRDALPQWIDEVEIEKLNDNAKYGVCWHKRRRTTDPGKWFVTMTGQQWKDILTDLGYLPAPPEPQ